MARVRVVARIGVSSYGVWCSKWVPVKVEVVIQL